MGDIQNRGVGFDITIGWNIYSSVLAPAMLGLSIVIKVIAPWVQEQHAVDLVDDAVRLVSCAGTRTPVTWSGGRRQYVGGNLSICVHSRTLHNPAQVHIYQRFVRVRGTSINLCWFGGTAGECPGCGKGGITGITWSSAAAIISCLRPSFLLSFHPNRPFRHSICPLKCC